MSCENYKTMLHSYLNNELNAFEETYVSEHIKGCLSCKREMEEIKRLKTIAAAVKMESIQLDSLKNSIMSAIRVTKKVKAAVYDIKVVRRLGTSMVACGVLVFLLNFSALGSGFEAHEAKVSLGLQEVGQRITQPIAVINKGLSDMSSRIVDLNGITLRLEQRIRGGM